MKTLGVVANCTKERASAVLGRIADKASALGVDLLADKATATLLKAGTTVSMDELFDSADGVIALGGDGTMLRVVRAMGEQDKPIMGVNLGGLGFLTSVAEEELGRALECVAADSAEIKVRSLAECRVMDGERDVARYRALNEIVIGSTSSRVVTLDLSIDADHVTSYVCDGLIVSTPTGSTGYSLSAGGPILVPDTSAFIVCPICPHALSSRPLVVPDNSEITVAGAGSTELVLTADGQAGQALGGGESVVVRSSSRSVRVMHLPGHSYFSVLRQKLKWRGSSM
ncbi:NAD(+)/NADH kinase [Verrucomicrobiota bacterium]